MRVIYIAEISEDIHGLSDLKDALDETLVAEGYEVTESTIREDEE